MSEKNEKKTYLKNSRKENVSQGFISNKTNFLQRIQIATNMQEQVDYFSYENFLRNILEKESQIIKMTRDTRET